MSGPLRPSLQGVSLMETERFVHRGRKTSRRLGKVWAFPKCSGMLPLEPHPSGHKLDSHLHLSASQPVSGSGTFPGLGGPTRVSPCLRPKSGRGVFSSFPRGSPAMSRSVDPRRGRGRRLQVGFSWRQSRECSFWQVSVTRMRTAAVSHTHSRAGPGRGDTAWPLASELGGCGRHRPGCGCPRSREESHPIRSLLRWGWRFERQTFVIIIKYSVYDSAEEMNPDRKYHGRKASPSLTPTVPLLGVSHVSPQVWGRLQWVLLWAGQVSTCLSAGAPRRLREGRGPVHPGPCLSRWRFAAPEE